MSDLGNGIYEVYFVDYGNKTKIKEDQVNIYELMMDNHVTVVRRSFQLVQIR